MLQEFTEFVERH